MALTLRTRCCTQHLHCCCPQVKQKGTTVIITTQPVGVSCDDPSTMLDSDDIKPAIRAAVKGCGELHALGELPKSPLSFVVLGSTYYLTLGGVAPNWRV